VSRSAPRRRAEPAPRRQRRVRSAPIPPATPVETPPESPAVVPADRTEPRELSRGARFARSRWPLVLWAVAVLTGLVGLVACLFEVGPDWACCAGAVIVATAYSWALAVRTGGRPIVAGALALALGLTAVISDDDALRTVPRS